MKNYTKLFLLLITALFLGTALSCSDGIKTDSATYGKADGTYITVHLAKAERTVLPVIESNSLSNLVLKGAKSGESAETLGSWENVSAMDEATIAITGGKWTFTLTAKSGGTTLSGTVEKDIVEGEENALSFTLSISNAGTGNGSFSIELDFSETEGADAVSYALASLEKVDGKSVISETKVSATGGILSFSNAELPVGTYRAKIVFYATKDGVDFEVATWRELVQIATGVTSSAERKIESFDELYTITYILNGGTTADGVTLQKTVNRKSTVLLPDLSRDYYDFKGWYTDEACTDGNEITQIEDAQSDITVYAKFTATVYTIEYRCRPIGRNTCGDEEYGAFVNFKWTFPQEPPTTYTVEDDVVLYEPTSDDIEFVPGLLVFALDGNESDTVESTGWKAGERHGNMVVRVRFSALKATAEDVAEKLVSMYFVYESNEIGTIKVSGEFDSLSPINSGFNKLAQNRYSASTHIFLDLSEVTGITELGKWAFSDETLWKISLPKTLTAIGDSAFYSSQNLREVNIPSGVKTIGKGAFSVCRSLTEIVIPDTVTSIGSNAFTNCTSLGKITIPFTGLSADSPGLFGEIFGDKGESAAGEKVTTVNQVYYDANGKLQTATYYIPSSLYSITLTSCTTIPSGAFSNLSNGQIYIPASVTKIEGYAFKGCSCGINFENTSGWKKASGEEVSESNLIKTLREGYAYALTRSE